MGTQLRISLTDSSCSVTVIMVKLSLKLLLGGLLFSASATMAAARFSGSAMEGMDAAEAIQREQLQRMSDFLGPHVEQVKSVAKREAPIAFRNPRAKEFFVDGTKIPDGESHPSFGDVS